MMSVVRSGDQMILKPSSGHVIVGVGFSVMVLCGIHLLHLVLPLPEDYHFGDIFGVVFLSCWILLTAGMAAFSYSMYFLKFTISDQGVSYDSWFRKVFLSWADVRDWGLSYSGRSKHGENVYDLYFSPHVCLVKNDCKKKLKGKMIKFQMVGKEYGETVSRIIPFCRMKTTVEPFIGKDIFHFLL